MADLLAALRQGVVQGARLLDGAGEAVQQAAGFGVGAAEALEQHADRDFVRDELAAVHVLLGQDAEFGAIADVFAEHVAGGDVDEAGGLDDAGGLGALSGAGGAEQDDVHG